MGFYVDNNGNQKKVLSVVRTTTTGEIVVDSELSLTSENPVQNKVITRELNKKVDQNGKVAFADNLTPYSETSGANDTTPFVFQSSGGESDVGSIAYLKALRGNTVAFNQLVKNGNFANSDNWGASGTLSVSNNVATFTANTSSGSLSQNLNVNSISSHKYLIRFNIQLTSATDKIVCLVGYESTTNINISATTDKQSYAQIITTNAQNNKLRIYFRDTRTSNWDAIKVSNVNFFDLTLMFGAGKEPTSVEEFNRLFTKLYYDYNAGELMSCKLNGYKIIGYNAWDEESQAGDIDDSTGEYSSTGSRLCSKNFIRVIQGQTYTTEFPDSVGNYNKIYFYDFNKNFISVSNINLGVTDFVVPNNACYIKFKLTSNYGTVYKNDVAIHLTWDGSKTGYEEYYEKTYPLPNVELRSAGNVCDELKPNGTLIRKVGTYTFTGNEADADIGIGGVTPTGLYRYYYMGLNQSLKVGEKVGGICDKLPTDTGYYNTATNPCVRFGQNNNAIYFYFTEDMTKAQFKEKIAGMTIYYELAEPTEDTSEIYTFTEQTEIDDFGTQEFLYDSEIDIPIPQGNEFFYPVDYKAFVDSLGGREDIEYDASEIVSHTELSEYLTTISGYDATKIQTLKNINGTFTWVDDE